MQKFYQQKSFLVIFGMQHWWLIFMNTFLRCYDTYTGRYWGERTNGRESLIFGMEPPDSPQMQNQE